MRLGSIIKSFNYQTNQVKVNFQAKKDPNGKIVRHKAMLLVAEGCSQKFGIDYETTYSLYVNSILNRYCG